MTDGPRKVKILIIKYNSPVEITGFTRIDEGHNNQGSIVKFCKTNTKTQEHRYMHAHSLSPHF